MNRSISSIQSQLKKDLKFYYFRYMSCGCQYIPGFQSEEERKISSKLIKIININWTLSNQHNQKGSANKNRT